MSSKTHKVAVNGALYDRMRIEARGSANHVGIMSVVVLGHTAKGAPLTVQ